MRILRADAMGMCFGVRDAVEMALSSPDRHELTVLGELVHNADVGRRLRAAGIRSVASTQSDVSTPQVLITAHGAADSVLMRLQEEGLRVRDATCPLVHYAHRKLRELVRAGYFPVIVGRPDHVEVRGLTDDLAECAIVRGPQDVSGVPERARIGVISQTTQPIDLVLMTVERIRARFPASEVRFVDTVCQPTKDRQSAARRLAQRCEVVVVVGGRNSNNTRQLVRTCAEVGARAYQVEGASDLCPRWFEGVDSVGLTAGTSTPDEVIVAVHNALEAIGARREPLAPKFAPRRTAHAIR